MEKTKTIKMIKKHGPDWIMPVSIVILALIFGRYVLEYPKDSIVSSFLTLPKIITCLRQHIYLIVVSSTLAICTSVPLGLILTRKMFKKICGFVVALVNICQTIPSFAVIALFVGILGIGAKTAIFALWIYSLLPILNNTIAGINGVNPSIIDAARGMGMTKAQILFKIEVPLAFPVIFAGIRTAVVINVATAIIAAFVGAGGLGDLIIAGKNINRMQIMLLGAGYATMLALFIDSILGIIEKRLTTTDNVTLAPEKIATKNTAA